MAGYGVGVSDWHFKPHRRSAAVAPTDLTADLTPPLCLVPGLAGSRLVDAAGKTRWMTLPRAMDCCECISRPLTLPLEWDVDKQQSDGLVPDDVLKELSCCGATAKNIYGEFDSYFSQQGRTMVTFSYDFRRDLNESAARLEAHLENVVAEHGQPAQVVAHSLGCMLALAVLHRRPELVHSAVLCGGVFAGGPGFHELTLFGIFHGVSNHLLSPAAATTWASSYQMSSLAPSDRASSIRHQEIVDLDELKQGRRTVVPFDWYTLDDWKRLQLGPWRPGQPPVSDALEAHVATAVKLGHRFQWHLEHSTRPAHEYPPIATLVSVGHPGRDHIAMDTKTSMLYGLHRAPKGLSEAILKQTARNSDGVVLEDASVPHGVPFEKHISRNNVKHGDLVDETEQLDEILEGLRRRAKGAAAPPPAPLSMERNALSS